MMKIFLLGLISMMMASSAVASTSAGANGCDLIFTDLDINGSEIRIALCDNVITEDGQGVIVYEANNIFIELNGKKYAFSNYSNGQPASDYLCSKIKQLKGITRRITSIRTKHFSSRDIRLGELSTRGLQPEENFFLISDNDDFGRDVRIPIFNTYKEGKGTLIKSISCRYYWSST